MRRVPLSMFAQLAGCSLRYRLRKRPKPWNRTGWFPRRPPLS
jgi:hypothetical protein